MRTRFAPSPTGKLHLGHARTALVGWLRARAAGGEVVLRLEDLDGPRVVAGAADAIVRDLAWLGLDWDEGEGRGGPCGPYVQSERQSRYEEAVARLGAAGHLYPCTCSRKEIAAVASAPHSDEEGPRYPGTCREGPSHPGHPAALRFRMAEPSPGFDDGLHGAVPPGLGEGDFVVRRADGIFAYQLAVVVDDAAMGITEVVRGDDLLASTPRQIALYRALGLPTPAFLHVPLVLGADGRAPVEAPRLDRRCGLPRCRPIGRAGRRPARGFPRASASGDGDRRARARRPLRPRGRPTRAGRAGATATLVRVVTVPVVGVRCRLMLLPLVARLEDCELHAPVEGAAFGRVVRGDGIALAVAHVLEP